MAKKQTGRQYSIGRVGVSSSGFEGTRAQNRAGINQITDQLSEIENQFQRAIARSSEREGTEAGEVESLSFLDEKGNLKRDENGNVVAPTEQSGVLGIQTIRTAAHNRITRQRWTDVANTDIERHAQTLYSAISKRPDGSQKLNRLDDKAFIESMQEYKAGFMESIPASLKNDVEAKFKEQENIWLARIDENITTRGLSQIRQQFHTTAQRNFASIGDLIAAQGSGLLLDRDSAAGQSAVEMMTGNLTDMVLGVDGGIVNDKEVDGVVSGYKDTTIFSHSQFVLSESLTSSQEDLLEKLGKKQGDPMTKGEQIAFLNLAGTQQLDEIGFQIEQGNMIVSVPEWDGKVMKFRTGALSQIKTPEERVALAETLRAQSKRRLNEATQAVASEVQLDKANMEKILLRLHGARTLDEATTIGKELEQFGKESGDTGLAIQAIMDSDTSRTFHTKIEGINGKIANQPDDVWFNLRKLHPEVVNGASGKINYLMDRKEWETLKERVPPRVYRELQILRVSALANYLGSEENQLQSTLNQYMNELNRVAMTELQDDAGYKAAQEKGDIPAMRRMEMHHRQKAKSTVGNGPTAPPTKKNMRLIGQNLRSDYSQDAWGAEYDEHYRTFRAYGMPSEAWVTHMKFGRDSVLQEDKATLIRNVEHFDRMVGGDPYMAGVLASDGVLGENFVRAYQYLRHTKDQLSTDPKIAETAWAIIQGDEGPSQIDKATRTAVKAEVLDMMGAEYIDPSAYGAINDTLIDVGLLLYGDTGSEMSEDKAEYVAKYVLGRLNAGPNVYGADQYTYASGRGRQSRKEWFTRLFGVNAVMTRDAVTAHYPDTGHGNLFYSETVDDFLDSFDGEKNDFGYDLKFGDQTFLVPDKPSMNRNDKPQEWRVYHVLAGDTPREVKVGGEPLKVPIGKMYEKHIREKQQQNIELLIRQFTPSGTIGGS